MHNRNILKNHPEGLGFMNPCVMSYEANNKLSHIVFISPFAGMP